jgi:hypothetical protein
MREKFEDTEGVNRSCNSEEDKTMVKKKKGQMIVDKILE